MALWLEHPKYVPARDHLIEYLRSSKYRFRRLGPVLFLCGGANSPSRDAVRDYLSRHAPGLTVFYAERVWEQIAARANRTALKMESDLASLADLVIIIVESPGTFAELGAFSLSDPLRKKILPIVDRQYRNEQSFIATGPLRWVDSDSDFSPTIYAALCRILEVIDQIEDRIRRIPKSHSVRISDLATSPKHVLFFICDLISVIHPATVEMVAYYLGKIAPSILASDIDIPTLVGLGVAMGLLRQDRAIVGGATEVFLSPATPEAVGRPFHHTRLLDLESLRAIHVSVLLAIREARATLKHLQRTV